MQTHLRKTLLLGVCTIAGALGVGSLASSPAQAQFSPCQVLNPGYLAPPPCISFDYKRLSDIATKVGQERAKIQKKVEEIQGWASGQAIMGRLNAPSGVETMTGPSVLTGLPQTFSNVNAGTTFMAAKAGSSSMFADGGSSMDKMGSVQALRDLNTRAATADGMALSFRKGQILEGTLADAARLAKAASESPDLRSDWAINSQTKHALAQARVTQNYLWQAYLQVQSTGQIKDLPVGMGTKMLMPSGSTGKDLPIVDNGDALRLQRLVALNAEAEDVLGRLGASRSADQLSTIVNVAKADCADTQARKENMERQFPISATNWACKSSKCSNGTTIVNTTNATLSNWKNSMKALQGQSIESLRYEFEKRGLDVAQLTASDTDPRQFIGTWGDPNKYDMVSSIAKNLYNGKRDAYNLGASLDKHISGDRDEAAFKQMVYDYEDVRQEYDWKFSERVKDENGMEIEGSGGACVEAAFSEAAVDTLKKDVQKDTSTTLNPDAVKVRLQEIADEGTKLGQELAQSSDTNTVSAAKQHLDTLQVTLNGGVQLPDHNAYDPAQCQAASEYAAQQGVSMTAEEMQACLHGSDDPASPYYVAR